MKILAIDIETTGLDPEICQILEFACVLENTENPKPVNELPYFRKIIFHDFIKGEPVALMMNADLIKQIAEDQMERIKDQRYMNDDFTLQGHLGGLIQSFLATQYVQGPVNIIGKNFEGFDKKFLEKVFDLKKIIPHHRRYLDPAILFHDPAIDKHLPDSKTCLQRAGLTSEGLHTALQDARNCIKLYRIGKRYTTIL